jgi:CheY-like chemotaxis protein
MGWQILVADDDSDIRMLFKVMLVKKYNCEIIEASDGTDAIDLIRTKKLNMAVLDIMMPRLNGDKVFFEMRKHPSTKDLPVLFCSALNNRDYIRLLFSLISDNITDFIMKPIQIPILYNKIERLIEKVDLLSEQCLLDDQGVGNCNFPSIGIEYSIQITRVENIIEDDEYSISINDILLRGRFQNERKPIVKIPSSEDGSAAKISFKFLYSKKRMVKIFYKIL